MKAMSALPDEPGGTPPSMPTRIGQLVSSVGAVMTLAGFGLLIITLIYLNAPFEKSAEIDVFFTGGLIGGGLLAVGLPLLVVGLAVRSVGTAYSATTHADQQPPPPPVAPGRPTDPIGR